MNNNNDEKIREIINTEDIPEEISPESIKKMLDEKTAGKRRSRISVTGRVTAAACACAVLAGTAVGTTKYMKFKSAPEIPDSGISSGTPESTVTKKIDIVQADAPYMNSAESYEQIYEFIKEVKEARESTKTTGGYLQGARGEMGLYVNGAIDDLAVEDDGIYFEEAAENEGGYYFTAAPESSISGETGGMGDGGDDGQLFGEIVPETTEEATDSPTEEPTEEQTEAPTEEQTQEPTEEFTEEATEEATEEETDPDDYSKTHNQEEGVLEADIVKTDGKRIYYVYNDFKKSNSGAFMNIAEVDNGKFTDTYMLDLTLEQEQRGDEWYGSTYVTDIYLYNDMLAVLGTADSSYKEGNEYFSECETFVSFYTLDSEPELIGTYHQEGVFNDVRITPEGYMYLITNDNSNYCFKVKDVYDTDNYIPHCGVGEMNCLPAQDILLPKELDNSSILSYTIIGSIDLTVAGEFSVADTKALAGYSGQIYCSADNLYTATQTYSSDNSDGSYSISTDITRIAVNGGNIVPQASGTVNGYINDQYSMSEYNGFFRVAVSCNMYRDANENGVASHTMLERFNSVYVLDMDMNVVGGVEGFGRDETVKSVRFSGNSAFVVTYEQTDPLFAIDLSDPTDPFITDSFKILGYSTYMEQWDEGHLLGFGMDADEEGIETGIKLVMFDNSDPYDLKEVGIYRMLFRKDNGKYDYIWSEAVWDSKALLVAPEKNLIGVPVESADELTSCFKFFSYEDGEFIYKGELTGDYYSSLNRAVYIGGYVYAVSGDCFISADIETLTKTDTAYFN